MAERDVVVLSGRSVCSLLGTAKSGASVVGQDGGHSLVAGDVAYWTFGDTVLAGGGLIPNSVGWSADMNASDCINLQPKEEGGVAVPLLRRVPGELTVWPAGMDQTGPGEVHFYYYSIVADPLYGWRVAGVGIASFDTSTLTGERAREGQLVWSPDGLMPHLMLTIDDGYVYTFLGAHRDVWFTDTIIARVPTASVESPGEYEYWESSTETWIGGLWDEATGTWDAALGSFTPLWSQVGLLNGLGVAYNQFLERWVGVYSTNLLSATASVNIRTAEHFTGPWDDQETVLVNCEFYHGESEAVYPCYGGNQHDIYEQDGGRTIYVTYSQGDDYVVYLHETRLASPVTEYTDAAGAAVYLPAAASSPDGFEAAGLAFYASDIPVPGFNAIHQFRNAATGQNRYGSTPPADVDYQDLGVAFYAPTDADAAAATNELYSPVFRWTLGGEERYSPINLASAGYERHFVAFYSPCPGGDGEAEASCLWSIRSDEPFHFDSDGDGCSDLQELGLDATAGGQRDPNNPYDFYDVTGRGGGPPDGVVDLSNDIFGVIQHYAPAGTEPEYDVKFDRGPSPGPDPWNMTAPDGVIDFTNDVLGVIYQYRHECA